MIISDSTIRRFQLCERKDFFRGVVDEGMGTKRLNGIIMHDALAALYSGQDHVAALETSYAQNRPTGMPASTSDEFDRSYELVQKILALYVKHYIPETTWLAPITETEFIVSLGEECYACHVPYTTEYAIPDPNNPPPMHTCGAEVHYLLGRADLIVTEKGKLLVVDHKTSNGGGQDYLNTYANSFQLMGYVYGVRRITSMDVRGYTINFIKFLKTLDTRGNPFLRATFRVGTLDLDGMVANRLAYAKVISAMRAMPTPEHKANDRSCHWGGRCAYYDICWNSPGTAAWWDPPSYMLAQEGATVEPTKTLQLDEKGLG